MYQHFNYNDVNLTILLISFILIQHFNKKYSLSLSVTIVKRLEETIYFVNWNLPTVQVMTILHNVMLICTHSSFDLLKHKICVYFLICIKEHLWQNRYDLICEKGSLLKHLKIYLYTYSCYIYPQLFVVIVFI